MNIRQLLPSVALLALLFGPAVAAEPDKTPTDAKPATVDPKAPETGLKEAMTAEAVRQIMGKPEEVKAIKAPNGKAEIWAYVRPIGDRTERVELGSTPIVTTIIDADGKPHQQSVDGPPQYHEVHHVSEDVIELLMFNDHYVTHKVTRHERQYYN